MTSNIHAEARTCQNCGKDISHKQASAIFCCRSCKKKAYYQKNKDKLREKAKIRMKRIRMADREAFNAKQKTWKQNNKKRVQIYRMTHAKKNGRSYRKRGAPTERHLEQLVTANARQAWQFWIKEKAPHWWLDIYWRAKNKPWRNPRLSSAEAYRIRYREDVEFMLAERLRRQEMKKRKRDGVSELIRGAIRRGHKSRTIELRLGYSIAEFKQHIEKQFTRGMSWQRFKAGDIHIDHIIPQATFDLTDDEQWRKCWSLSNLQPLWAEDNIKKSCKIKTLC